MAADKTMRPALSVTSTESLTTVRNAKDAFGPKSARAEGAGACFVSPFIFIDCTVPSSQVPVADAPLLAPCLPKRSELRCKTLPAGLHDFRISSLIL